MVGKPSLGGTLRRNVKRSWIASMLDHLSIGVRDFQRSIAFYDAVFAPLNYVRVWDGKKAAGYGEPGGEDRFAIKEDAPESSVASSPRSHLAISAKTREMVVVSYNAAISAGGTDLGKPWLRPRYGENYFAAFISDPDGYRIEIVCHAAEST